MWPLHEHKDDSWNVGVQHKRGASLVSSYLTQIGGKKGPAPFAVRGRREMRHGCARRGWGRRHHRSMCKGCPCKRVERSRAWWIWRFGLCLLPCGSYLKLDWQTYDEGGEGGLGGRCRGATKPHSHTLASYALFPKNAFNMQKGPLLLAASTFLALLQSTKAGITFLIASRFAR